MLTIMLYGCCMPYPPKNNGKIDESNQNDVDTDDRSIIITKKKDDNIKNDNNECGVEQPQDYVVKATDSNIASTVSSISFESSFYNVTASKINSFSQDSNFDFLSESNDDFIISSSNDDEDEEDYDNCYHNDKSSLMSGSTKSSSTFDYYADDDYYAIMKDISNLMNENYDKGAVKQSTSRDYSMEDNSVTQKSKENSYKKNKISIIVTKGYQSKEVDAVRNSNFKLLQGALMNRKKKIKTASEGDEHCGFKKLCKRLCNNTMTKRFKL